MNKLVVLSNNGLANEYPLEGSELVIGRDADCEIRLNHRQVSRRHARLVIEADRVLVSDLGSRNGTFVGGRRIEGPTPLHDELVAIGQHKLFLARAEGAPTQCGPVHAQRVAEHPLDLPDTEDSHWRTNTWPRGPQAQPGAKGEDERGAAA